MQGKYFTRYIGNAVYVEYDGYHIVLKTGSDIDHDCIIYLDPEILNQLDKYRKDLNDILNKKMDIKHEQGCERNI